MTVVLDASAVIALHEVDDVHHREAVSLVQQLDEDLVCTPLVLAEIDFVVRRRGGVAAQQVVWNNFAKRAYTLRWWADAIDKTIAIARARPHLGLADASLVALADLLPTDRIFTFDAHFRDLVTPDGRTLRMLP